MTPRSRFLSLLLVTSFVASPALCEPQVKSDILPGAQRQPAVALAQKLAQVPALSPLSHDLKSPFNPPGFEQEDEDEAKAKVAAAAAEPVKPKGDRDILEIIASKVNPSGTFIMGGEPMLLISKKKFKIGDSLTIAFDGRDYEIEITSIERTSFSLRLNRAEISRPIKSAPAKNP
ncbi:MAG: hypothetical protein WC378_13245 [Opitutaceae bacterium]|jgi:hypothetical protein